MFRGDQPDLRHALHQALATSRDLRHPRVGSEHLLLGLSDVGGTVAAVLSRHGATRAVILDVVRLAARHWQRWGLTRTRCCPASVRPPWTCLHHVSRYCPLASARRDGDAPE
jgi:hypothetical protein